MIENEGADKVLTTKRYSVTTDNRLHRFYDEVEDTYFLGIRVRRKISQVWVKGSELTDPIRSIVYRIDSFQCVYCGVTPQNPKKKHDPTHSSVDHVIPQSQGGSSYLFNLVTACRSCNSTKNGRTPHEANLHFQYGRFRKRSIGYDIPYSKKEFYKLTYNQVYDSRNGEPWEQYVRLFGFGEPFDTEFIACDGRISYLY